ncbi:hypothetical protein Poli38472_009080 [Pythium oligandrum]|uniref:Uncharacterized protein n=1 Tax=Pythium oligandrum TaxID=41045 RepID=A0A8K1CM98_PYTOL|nr:hypothetical protein Poli38472_009080 [Pythium oligandrum]|eukprot:TMW64913.1 hypothetical protein Poli38472_009080 [Pythium oligandrum]
MQDLGGENSANAKKIFAKAHRLLQLVTTKRHALALRDYREVLEECLKTEASGTMKILGYRMASRVPTCTTHEIWQMLLEAAVMELASSQNAAVLVFSIPMFEQFPIPLVLSFLITSEKEPMNKLRAVLSHEDTNVRCCAITSLAKMTLEVATSLTNDGLYAFAFESHEARNVCQQDVWTMIVDVWKIIFQSLLLGDVPDVSGAAFTAMRMLFAKTTVISQLALVNPPKGQNQSAANDLAASVYKEACPRIRSLYESAKALPVKNQVDAAAWLAMLLYMMMERTGAQCPSLSVPYLEIDMFSTSQIEDDDGDDVSSATTERARMDELSSSLLETWMLPLLEQKTTLAQKGALCRAVFLLLSHPLLEFTRIRVAGLLVRHLVAQCHYHKTFDARMEMNMMLVRSFAWVSSNDCLTLFSRPVETIHLMERESDRKELLQLLMDTICRRIISSRDFLLLESICTMDLFRQLTGSSIAQRSNSSRVFKALIQALVLRNGPAGFSMERQVAQLIVLKAFHALLVVKVSPSLDAQPGDPEGSHVMCYVTLLSEHFRNLVNDQKCVLRESLLFYQEEVLSAVKKIESIVIRLQLLWVGIQLSTLQEIVPVANLVELLSSEISKSYTNNRNNSRVGGDTAGGAPFSGTIDDGRLGGSFEHGDLYRKSVAEIEERDDGRILLALLECLKALARRDPQQLGSLETLRTQLHAHFTTLGSSLQCQLLEEPFVVEPAAHDGKCDGYVLAAFRPGSLFQPPRYSDLLESTNMAKQHQQIGQRHRAVITGSTDPFTLEISYRQTIAHHEDVVTLSVACCNTSSVSMDGFEIHVRPKGPVRCIDPSNDLKMRMLQGCSSSSLPPSAILKFEKRFLVQRFAEVEFYFQVVFSELEAAASEESNPPSARLAVSVPYALPFDALFRRPREALATAAFFQASWNSAEDATLFRVESAQSKPSVLGFCQSLLKLPSDRICVIDELMIDLPIHTHICYLAKTRWDDYVAISVTLSRPGTAGTWFGVCEVRSTKPNVFEFSRSPQGVLTVICGDKLQITTEHDSAGVANSSGSEALARPGADTLRTASRSKPAPPAVDPFAGTSADFSGGSDTTSKWTQPAASAFDSPFGGFDTDQVRAPAPSASFGDPSSANNDPWGF